MTDTLVARFLAGLPYELTKAQRRALAVIVADMAGPFPMHRLLQGDVGSGKTVVALAALLAAVQSGHQGALMVPTEVLAEQHFSAVRALLGDLEGPGGMAGGEVRVELLTSRVKGKARAAVLDGLASGEVGIVVGTHALLTEEVAFGSLGAVVIDEQHRFGVEQRATLRAKGADGDPDLLVMTATPIPRTAAMVIFGDLDLTTLDELPPGRLPVTTEWLPGRRRHGGEERGLGPGARGGGGRPPGLRRLPAGRRLAPGRGQVGHRGVRAAGGRASWPACGSGSCTGRWRRRPARRSWTASGPASSRCWWPRRSSRSASTSPRRRSWSSRAPTASASPSCTSCGAGSAGAARASWCYLLGGEEGNERLAAVAGSTDGFALAEADLRVRGEGTLLGARQKGQSDLRLASLTDAGDLALLDEARRVAETLVDEDPQLDGAPRPGRRGQAAAQRGRGGVPLQELIGPPVGWGRCGSSEAGAAGAGWPPSSRRRCGPTSDRVREAIFDILGSQGGVEGLRVVDLFCGSGALGVEALSRGAASATFVDLDPDALGRRPPEPRGGGPGRRAGHAGAGRAARMAGLRRRRGVRPRAVRPPLRLRGLAGAARRAAGGRRRHGIGGARSRCRGPWVVTRERRYGGTLVTVAHRSGDGS